MMRILLVFAGALAAAAFATAQTITAFRIGYLYDLTQTSGSGSSAGSTPYGFFAEVVGSSFSGTYQFTTPGGSASSPQPLADDEGDKHFEIAEVFADTTALYAAYNTGNYVFDIPNTNLSNTAPDQLTLTLNDTFANAFSITNGTWSGGKLLIDPTQAYTITFDSFAGMVDGVDVIVLGIDAGYDDFSSSSATTSFLIPANSFSLAPGQTTSAELVFAKVVDVDNSLGSLTLSGGTYATIVTFQIQAIPEPSTYAAIFGGLALAGVMLHRVRRKARAA